MSGSEGMTEISTANNNNLTEISTGNVNLTELSPEEQKQVIYDIARDGEARAKEGDTYYITSIRWWRIWSGFVNQNPSIGTNEGSSMEHQGSVISSMIPRPTSIDNYDLVNESLSENSDFEIYDTLVEGTDYILLPEEIWNQLHAWYGGGPALARKAISRGTSQTELTVEVYLLRLQLHLMPRADQHAIRMSRKETIGALRIKACEIFDLNSDQVNIWDYYGRRKYALLNDLYKTLDEANIQTDQDILVEVIDYRGSSTTVAQTNGSSGNNSFSTVKLSRTNDSITGSSSGSNSVPRGCNSELSQFQNLSFPLVGANTRGSTLGLIGLLNFGNTCFMNSAIQCLVHTPEIAYFFLGDFHKEINWQNPLGMEGELALAFGELLRNLWLPGRGAVAPRTFKEKLAQFAPQFGGRNQHDSQELLAFLLDGLHEDLNRVKEKPNTKSRDADGRPDEQAADEYWADHISRNDSIIVDVCQGQYKSTLICPVCDKISVTFDPFMYLSLPLQSVTPRSMTVTVIPCDGSLIPAACTVTVPKQGRIRDLMQAISNACSLNQNEEILLAKIQDHLIHRFLEDPLLSLSDIKDNECLSAYKIPKSMKKTIYLQLVHRREEPNTGGTTTWKPFGTPLVFPVSSDETITIGDVQSIAHTILSPLLNPDKSDSNNPSIASDPPSKKNSQENGDSLEGIPLKLVDGNNDLIDISVGEEKPIKLSSSSMSLVLYIDWSPELVKKYEMGYLENLPEVFKNRSGKKKARVKPLTFYTCLEAFLQEERLVPEDMWFCPQCQEKRQASKKLDIWRLPEVLVIHLKRFSYSKTVKSKIETFVNFPLHDLDLTRYVANKNNTRPQVYELYALSNHYGNMRGGHYTAYVKRLNENKWYNFDDSNVTAIGEDVVKSNAAYLLFYRRVRNTGGAAVSIGSRFSTNK